MNTEDTVTASADPVWHTDLAPYRLLREIGRGGMSVVYEALDTRTGQPAALKVLALPFSVTAVQRGDLVARFRREERAVTQLSHPNIVAIHEVGEQAGVHFIAMEFLPGESLRARLERGPLTLPEAGAVLTQIAAALTAVHGAGIVHRDVKPSNVMLLPDGGAKLLDFGVARHADDTAITSGGLVVGSPAYLSPEQVRGGAGTTASDVWALGVLLYEMLAGRPPFQATDVAAVMYQVIHEPPPPLSGLPPGLGKVLKRALDKTPERRFPSALALAEAFAAALPAERASRPLPHLAVLTRPAILPHSAILSHSAVLPRWAWGVLPLLFVLAVVAGLRGRQHLFAPAPPVPVFSGPVSPAPKAALPVSAPAVSVPAVSVPTVPVARPSPRPRTPPGRGSFSVPTPDIAPAASTAGRPRPAAGLRPHRPRLFIKPLPAPRLPSKPPLIRLPPPLSAGPHRKNATNTVAQTAPEDTPPAVSPPPSVPARGTPVAVRPVPPRKPSKADDEAAEAARLQKFIWSEGR